jgi:hypothetical protein
MSRHHVVDPKRINDVIFSAKNANNNQEDDKEGHLTSPFRWLAARRVPSSLQESFSIR